MLGVGLGWGILECCVGQVHSRIHYLLYSEHSKINIYFL